MLDDKAARRITNAVLATLSNRKGFDWWFDNLAESGLKEEIRRALIATVKKSVEKELPSPTASEREALKEALQGLRADCEYENDNVGTVVMHTETMNRIAAKNNKTIKVCDSLLKKFGHAR